MSDPDAGPDPMDKAYAQAEAALDDADARAARRARVLAAVAQEPATPQAATAKGGSAWRWGRWLAAACVAGLGVLIAIQIYHPADHDLHVASTASAAPSSAAPPAAAAPSAAAVAEAPTPPAIPAVPPAATTVSPPVAAKAAPPPPPPALAAAPPPEAFPAQPPPPPQETSAVTVTAERQESDHAVAAESTAGPRVQGAPLVAAPLAAQSRAAPVERDETSGGAPPDQGARLRAAAAAGRTAEVEALLAEGAPADAADAAGDTALMKSVQADHPAVAALLRRHGASLDRENAAGESARDMARAKGDAALDQALDLGP